MFIKVNDECLMVVVASLLLQANYSDCTRRLKKILIILIPAFKYVSEHFMSKYQSLNVSDYGCWLNSQRLNKYL